MRDALRIGELAARCGVSTDTIRFYEREGLLPRARRSAAQYRLYAEVDAERLRLIRQAQGMGLTLEDIRELLCHHELRTPGECRRVAQMLRDRIAAVDEKIAALRAFRRALAKSLSRCEQTRSESCPVVLDLLAGATAKRKGS